MTLSINVSTFQGERIYKIPEQLLAFGAADTVKSFTIESSAKVHSIVIAHPLFTNSVTCILSIENEDGRQIYATDPIANAAGVENIQALDDYVAMAGVCTIKATLSGVPGGTGGNVGVSMVLSR